MSKLLFVPKTKCPFRSWFGVVQKSCLQEKCAVFHRFNGEEAACSLQWIPFMQIEQMTAMLGNQQATEAIRNKLEKTLP